MLRIRHGFTLMMDLTEVSGQFEAHYFHLAEMASLVVPAARSRSMRRKDSNTSRLSNLLEVRDAGDSKRVEIKLVASREWIARRKELD